MHVLRIQGLVPKQRENRLDAKRTPIHKVSVEQIWVLCARHAVDLKDITQIVELSMHIATHGDVLSVGNIHANQRCLSPQNVANLAEDHEGVLLVKLLLCLVVLNQLLHKLDSHLAVLKVRPVIGRLHLHGGGVDGDGGGMVCANCLAKALLAQSLGHLIKLLPGVCVLGLDLDCFLEVLLCLLELAKSKVSCSSPEIALDVRRCELDRIRRVDQRRAVVLELDVGECTVGEEDVV
mmetsp:Transcript_9837/g.19138  ORF Transcript_9837/g.19138 Transcript_9837/m.19138 type:complete len:236 (+) Transcript_9837:903-1610(+)